MHLTEDHALKEKAFPDGWSMIGAAGARRAVFALKGKASFSLTYGMNENEVTVCVRKALDNYVRSGILYGALTAYSQHFVGLHGVTLSCRGRNVILSAPSGTGKTTLAGLLEKHCGARVINGDFALLTPEDEGVMFEPTPFCGTSGVCLDERVRVDRIVFLEQSDKVCWKDLDGRVSAMKFLTNAFLPTYDRMLEQTVRENIFRMMPEVSISSFAFPPTGEAANTFADIIEREDTSSQN